MNEISLNNGVKWNANPETTQGTEMKANIKTHLEDYQVYFK
ncbi:hypothetical protein [Marixanthomonas spongiae]|nr:hypothetical protein [Marixanthomonas spongiae]